MSATDCHPPMAVPLAITKNGSPGAAIFNQLSNISELRSTATTRRVLDSYLKVDTRTDHDLAWLDELITRGAHTKHVSKPRVDACIISNVLTDQLNPP